MNHPTRLSRRLALAGAVPALLAGCAAVDLSQFGIKPAEPGAPSGFSFTPAAPAAPTKAFIGSAVDGLLKKHPITNSQRPETWPRVAITLVSAPPSAFKTVAFAGAASIQATDCATYGVRVWTDARTSQAYENLRLCYGDLYKRLQGVPLY